MESPQLALGYLPLLLFMAGRTVCGVLRTEGGVAIVTFTTPFALIHFGHCNFSRAFFLLKNTCVAIRALQSFFHMELSRKGYSAHWIVPGEFHPWGYRQSCTQSGEKKKAHNCPDPCFH